MQVVTSLITGSSPFSIQLAFRTFANDGLLLALYSEDMAQVCNQSCDSHVMCHVIVV